MVYSFFWESFSRTTARIMLGRNPTLVYKCSLKRSFSTCLVRNCRDSACFLSLISCPTFYSTNRQLFAQKILADPTSLKGHDTIEVDVEKVWAEINEVKGKISVVEGQINAVEAKINVVSEQLQVNPSDELGRELQYLRTEKGQLRTEKGQLRTKEQTLAEKELLLRSHVGVVSREIPEHVLGRAKDAYATLLNPTIEVVADGMQVMRSVVALPEGETCDVVLRPIVIRFWRTCADLVGNNICVVGTPGIGKSVTTPYLIHVLLKKKRKVVYLYRSPGKSYWYFEFDPTDTANGVRVYPELTHVRDISSLSETTTDFIIDPGVTKQMCMESVDARVIIVTSPDSTIWGGNEFTKLRKELVREGVFQYYPMWTLQELKAAAPYCVPPLRSEMEAVAERQGKLAMLSQQLTEATDRTLSDRLHSEVEEARHEFERVSVEARHNIDRWVEARYGLFGGVPRGVFAPSDSAMRLKLKVGENVYKTPVDHLLCIMTDEPMHMDTGDPNLPSGTVIGYDMIDRDADKPFEWENTQIVVLSDYVRRYAYETALRGLWNKMRSKPDITSHGIGFEGYVLAWLTTPSWMERTEKRRLRARLIAPGSSADRELDVTKLSRCGLKDRAPKRTNLITHVSDKGGKADLLYSSANPMHPLFDFLFQRDDTFYAINATVSSTHNCPRKQLDYALNLIGNERKLVLIYAVPEEVFDVFETKPKDPFVPFTPKLVPSRPKLVPSRPKLVPSRPKSQPDISHFKSRCEIWVLGVCPPPDNPDF